MEQTRIVSADLGYGYSKAIDDQGNVVTFSSVIGPARQIAYHNDLVVSGKDYHTYTVNDADWFVGDFARLQVPTDEQISPQARERTNMTFTRVALAVAFDQLGIYGEGVKVRLVTGLPVKWYSDKDDLGAQLTGLHFWRTDGDPRQAEVVDILTLPQPVGSLFTAILDGSGTITNETLAAGRVGVLDIGMHTTDFVLLDALRYIEASSGSVEAAMGNVYDQVARGLHERYKLNKTLHDVDSIMRNGHKVGVYDRDYSILDLTRPAMQSVADVILGRVATSWGDGRDINRVLVTGGGAIPMSEYVRARFPHAQTLLEPEFANVRGYMRYGLRKWGESWPTKSTP